MTFRFRRINASLGGLALVGALACGLAGARGQEEDEVALSEARAALGASISKSVQLGIELNELRAVNENLLEGLAAANEESERYRVAYDELRLQMEALGVEAVREGSRGVSEKLMKAISDLRLVQQEKDALTVGLAGLSEAIVAYMQSAVSSNLEARVAVEAALRVADEARGFGEGKPERRVRQAFEGGKIVSVKRDFGVFVIDLGAKSGVKVGMPVEIVRKDRPIATAYIVDVRDHVSGATVRRLSSDDDAIEVGDDVRLDTQADY